MRDPIAELRSWLIELGCPLPRLQRLVQEVAEHREDSLRGLIADGLTPAEAEAQADLRLGDPRTLAENLMESLRRSSWCGRHRFVAFGLLPVLGFPLFWVAVLCFNLCLVCIFGYGWDREKLHVVVSNPITFYHLSRVVYSADYLSIALVTLGFCMLTNRTGVHTSWMLFACFMCAIYSLFIYTYVSPHNFTIGLSSHPQWLRGAIPLLIICLARANRLRQVRQLQNPFAKVV